MRRGGREEEGVLDVSSAGSVGARNPHGRSRNRTTFALPRALPASSLLARDRRDALVDALTLSIVCGVSCVEASTSE